MTKTQSADYSAGDNIEVFGAGAWFDSVGDETTEKSAKNAVTRAENDAPPEVKIIFDAIDMSQSVEVGEVQVAKQLAMQALFDGTRDYENTHGEKPSADLIKFALKKASSAVAFDDATTAQSKSVSFVANAIRVAMYSAFRDAVPFAYYMPVESSKGNKQIMAVIQAVAGSSAGGYKAADSISGGYAGKPYLLSSRTICMTSGSAIITSIMTGVDTCDSEAKILPLRRGLTAIQVAGMTAARETYTASGNSTIAGSIDLNGTQYLVSGTVNFITSKVSVNFTPELPANTPVHARVVIDYENNIELQPLIKLQALDYEVFAEQHYALISTTEEQASQISRELGVDAITATQVAVMGQFSLERYMYVLHHAIRLAVNNNVTFDFDWQNQKSQKSRAEIWSDLKVQLGKASQKMVEQTKDHGISHLYVDAETIGSEIAALPDTDFKSSGVTETSSITYAGLLWGKYRVYTVVGLFGTLPAGTGKILAIGRSEQASLNPFVLGDVEPLRFELAGRTKGHVSESTVKANCITDVNPHQPAAHGCAMIDVVGLN